MIDVRPVTLEGGGVRLEPLTEDHHDALATAAGDGRLWELWFIGVPPPEGMRAYVADALQGQRDGHMLPWAVRDLASGTVIGSTRYHDIVRGIDRVEIGHTWYAQSVIRHYGLRRDGSVRDVVMYSILAAEWPDVRRHLELRLARHATAKRP